MLGKALRPLGKHSRVSLPPLGYGGAGVMLGGSGSPAAGGQSQGETRVDIGFKLPTDPEAQAALEATWAGGLRYFDTAPWYGRGQSEHRVGRFLYDIKPRDSFTLSTKVGRLLHRPRYGDSKVPHLTSTAGTPLAR
jgi:aryl-alcohol dehydrogenase-like predicted oxidoreductase